MIYIILARVAKRSPIALHMIRSNKTNTTKSKGIGNEQSLIMKSDSDSKDWIIIQGSYQTLSLTLQPFLRHCSLTRTKHKMVSLIYHSLCRMAGYFVTVFLQRTNKQRLFWMQENSPKVLEIQQLVP